VTLAINSLGTHCREKTSLKCMFFQHGYDVSTASWYARQADGIPKCSGCGTSQVVYQWARGTAFTDICQLTDVMEVRRQSRCSIGPCTARQLLMFWADAHALRCASQPEA
jgi:DSHCT (NUC185) domain